MFGWLRRLFKRLKKRPAQPDRMPDRQGSETRPTSRDPDTTTQPLPKPSSSLSVEATVPVPKKNKKPALEDLKPVLNVLRAYVVTFEPEAEMELRAVVGAIVANISTVTVENAELEAFTDEAIAAFKSLGVDPNLVDVGAQLLAEQVAVWRREQEATVANVMSAYLQQFAPDAPALNIEKWQRDAIVNLAQTVVATLNDGSLSRSGGRVLVERVVESFDLEQALSRWVAPEWVALAQRVASYAEKGDLQAELRSIAWSYVQQFQSILSPQLIEQIMQEGSVTVTPSEFLSGSLTDFSRMLYYKYQLIAADPVVTKSHEEIAADVHEAIAQHKAKREPAPLTA